MCVRANAATTSEEILLLLAAAYSHRRRDFLVGVIPSINANDLIRHIPRLHHPQHCLRHLLWLTQSSHW